jgi:hypothetical protein
MAAVEAVQATVLEIAERIPNTENVRVHDDLADIALALPAALSARVAVKAKPWLDSTYHLLLPEKLGRLVTHLARGGQVDVALNLTRKILELSPDPRSTDQDCLPREPRPHFDDSHYEQILENHLPDLVAAAGERALWLLCDVLESALQLSRREASEQYEDYSWIWRRAIEDHEQNEGHSIKDLLVQATRTAAERLCGLDHAQVSGLVQRLDARKWTIFRRLALHLLRLHHSSCMDLIEKFLVDGNRFHDIAVRHEYFLLAQTCFGAISDLARITILGFVEAGPPNLDAFAERPREETGQPPSADEVGRYKHRWQLERLAPLKDSLPADWKSRYDGLVSVFHEPEHPEFLSYSSGVWCGPTSPKSPDELRTMTVPAILSFLGEWKPSGEWESPSREGLGRALSALVAAAPEEFAENAKDFQVLDPIYVRSLLMGLRDALNQDRAFVWGPVLDLLLWVTQQPREIPGRKVNPIEEDPDWGWTRKAIADLLSVGFKNEGKGLSFDLRGRAWRILEPLTDDPDPTPDREVRYGGTNMDPSTMSINTTRGEAMHCVVEYALWVRRHLERDQVAATTATGTLDEMPEVRCVLDRHLDVAFDPSTAVRSVYGRWFPWLEMLDHQWAADRVSKVFPAEAAWDTLRDAAWAAYLAFYPPYKRVFDLLRGEYERAIDRLGATGEGKHRAHPEERLAEHLMSLCWSGVLPPADDSGGLINRFFEKASDDLRAHAVGFIGRNLVRAEGEVDRDVAARLRSLWEWREQSTIGDSAQHSKELAAFGWWFTSRTLDEDWVLQHLREVLRQVRWAEPDHMVVEKLAAIAEKRPLDAVECLGAMVEADREGWGIATWADDARTLLSWALQSSDASARTAAVKLVNRLGALGHRDFGSLLRGA